jgi:phenylacetate-coenzyme A ligase PaaK-like adenylate-forming protein
MAARIKGKIGLRPVMELVPPGTLERTQFKARRVIDKRRLFE